jgi:predicted dehydrogenase
MATNTSQGKKLGVALVGLGSYTTNQLLPGLQQSTKCRLAGIVTGTPDKAEKWKAQYNIPDQNIYNYDNFDKIADNKDIDVVYVVLPNSMHKEFTIRAARAGKHVICEKPMALNVRDGQEMIDVCKKANVKLYIGYRLHFEPFNIEAARVGQSKKLGKTKIIEAAMGFKIGDPSQWRLKKALAGGGAVMDVGIYAIQAARYVTGEEPIAITAQEFKTDTVKFKEVDETVFWQMEFPSGAVSNSTTTYAADIDRLFFTSENGWFELQPAFEYGPLAGRTDKGPLNLPIVHHQASQLDGMATAIIENKSVVNFDGEEGLKDMKVIEALYKSIATGAKVNIS